MSWNFYGNVITTAGLLSLSETGIIPIVSVANYVLNSEYI